MFYIFFKFTFLTYLLSLILDNSAWKDDNKVDKDSKADANFS